MIDKARAIGYNDGMAGCSGETRGFREGSKMIKKAGWPAVWAGAVALVLAAPLCGTGLDDYVAGRTPTFRLQR